MTQFGKTIDRDITYIKINKNIFLLPYTPIALHHYATPLYSATPFLWSNPFLNFDKPMKFFARCALSDQQLYNVG